MSPPPQRFSYLLLAFPVDAISVISFTGGYEQPHQEHPEEVAHHSANDENYDSRRHHFTPRVHAPPLDSSHLFFASNFLRRIVSITPASLPVDLLL
jgi:hypothetical protein